MWPFFFSLSFFSFFFETFLLVSKEIREGISFRSWKLPRIDRINEDFYRNRSCRMREELEILKIYGRIFWIWMRSSNKNLIWERDYVWLRVTIHFYLKESRARYLNIDNSLLYLEEYVWPRENLIVEVTNIVISISYFNNFKSFKL